MTGSVTAIASASNESTRVPAPSSAANYGQPVHDQADPEEAGMPTVPPRWPRSTKLRREAAAAGAVLKLLPTDIGGYLRSPA